MTDTATDEIQLPAIMGQNLPEPTEVAEQYRAAFGTIYAKIEIEIAEATIDLTSKSGREAVASRAYKIARTKTGLQTAAKALTEDQQAIINVVNAETKTMRETLDGLRDKARAPLNKWEADEAMRIEAVEEGLAHLRDLGRIDATIEPENIREAIADAGSLFNLQKWGEHLPMAIAAHEAAIVKFTSDLAASERRIDDAAELAELRAQKEAADIKAKADRIEADRKIEEARLKQEAADALIKADANEAERQRLADERAKQDAAAMIKASKDRADKAEADAKQAEVDRLAAAKKAEIDKTEAAAFAVNEERNRQARIKATEDEAAEKREADLVHRKKINNAALKALITCSEITEAQAKMIVQAMAKGQVPHVTITY